MSATFQALAVAAAAVFAFLAIVSSRKCAEVLKQVQEIASALRSVRSKVETHDSELDAVTDALHTLRGKFYAERRKSQPTGSNSDTQEEATAGATVKDILRRKAGLVAGKPAPHN